MKIRSCFVSKNWLRTGLFTAITVFSAFSMQAQTTAPSKQWDKTFGGNRDDEVQSLQQTSDGGYILGGASVSGISNDKSQPAKGYEDCWVIKLDGNGNKVWDKSFGGGRRDGVTSIQQTSDGGYILGGVSESGAGGDKSQACQGESDYWVIKLDANGNKLWDKTYGGSAQEWLYSLQQTSDGGYILGGMSYSGRSGDKTQASKGGNDYWVVKLDASGNKQWDKTYGGVGIDELWSLQQTSDGKYIIGGTSSSPINSHKSQASRGGSDYWILMLDSNGNKLWDKTFGGSYADELHSLQQTSDGGFILGGFSRSEISGEKSQASKGGEDYWVVKLDANGNKLWDKTIGGSHNEWLNSLQQTSDGGYILGGYSWSDISGDKSEASRGRTDCWVVKLDAAGNKQWDKTYGGLKDQNWASGEDVISTIKQTSDGGYIWGGLSTSGINEDKSEESKGVNDVWVMKLSPPCSSKPGNLGPDVVACEGEEITLHLESTSGTFLWSDGSKEASLKVRQTGTYWLQLTKDGCVTTDTVQVSFKTCSLPFIPNIVTPNSDGKNDYFSPQNLPAGKWQLQVFNRWGIKLFESENYKNNWPDKKISDGTYYYLLRNPETGQQYKGWVEVAQ